MQVSSKLSLCLAAALLGLLAGGCSSSPQTLSKEDKARFGYAGMPMSPEARKALMGKQSGTPPPGAKPAQAAGK